MHNDESTKQKYLVLANKYKRTIKMVARRYYPHGDYMFESMLCDLTTHLWEMHPLLPQNLPDEEERVWIYTMLNNKARNMVRDEQLRLSRIEYCDTMPDVAEEDEGSRLVERLYRLIDELDIDESASNWTFEQYAEGLRHPLAEKQFAADLEALETCISPGDRESRRP